MNIDKQLQFIRSKTADINIALLHCYTRNLLTIPTSVINAFKIDETGNIFIYMPRPKQQLSQFDKEFPVDLNYSRKGASHFINIYGKARIVDDPEELILYDLTQQEISMALTDQMLLIVKIYKADYHEKTQPKRPLVDKLKSAVFNFLQLPASDERSYDFRNFNSPGSQDARMFN